MNPKRKKYKRESYVIAINPLSYSKRFRVIWIMLLIIFAGLGIRIAYIQFVEGAHLKELAYQQQTTNQLISPKRGTIYDSTGQKLAVSSVVDTVSINPKKIAGKDEE